MNTELLVFNKYDKFISNFLIKILIFLQPCAILFGFYAPIENKRMTHFFGIMIIGIALGCMLNFLFKRLNFNLESKTGIALLFSPIILLFSSTTLAFKIFGTKSSVLLWLVFFVVYFSLGAVLYVKDNLPSGLKGFDSFAFIFKVCFVLFVLLTFVINFFGKDMSLSPDSYSYYDISRNIFTNFGKVGTIRQYVVQTDYAISFPYLFPAIINIFDRAMGLGLYSGILINFIAAFITVYFALKCSKLICKSILPGLVASLALFCNVEYIGEVLAARAVPLAILCVAVIGSRLFKRDGYSKKDVLVIGLFTGAGMVIRFDFLLIAIFISIIMLILNRKNFKNILIYGIGVFIIISPWVIYSLFKFHTPWISDNGGTAFCVEASNPLRFFKPNEIIPSLFTNPSLWFTALFDKFRMVFGGLFGLIADPINLVILAGIIFTFLLSRTTDKKLGNSNVNVKIVIITILFCLGKTALLCLVGYGDLRYHTEVIFIFQLIILSVLFSAFKNKKWWITFCSVIMIFAFLLNIQPLMKDNVKKSLYRAPFVASQMNISSDAISFKNAVRNDFMEKGKNPNDAKVFFLDGPSFEFGAFMNFRCYAHNWNATNERTIYLLKNIIKPTHIYASDKSNEELSVIKMHYDLEKIDPVLPLYAVTQIKD